MFWSTEFWSDCNPLQSPPLSVYSEASLAVHPWDGNYKMYINIHISIWTVSKCMYRLHIQLTIMMARQASQPVCVLALYSVAHWGSVVRCWQLNGNAVRTWKSKDMKYQRLRCKGIKNEASASVGIENVWCCFFVWEVKMESWFIINGTVDGWNLAWCGWYAWNYIWAIGNRS